MMRLLGRTSSIVKQSIRQSASSHSPLNPLTASLSKFRSPNETPPSTDPTSRSQISDVSRSPPPRRYTPKVLVKAYVKPLSGESFVKDPQLSQLSVALSAGREDIDVNLLLGLVRDTYNSLKNLDPNLNLLVFNCLQNLNLCSKLRLSDWHRLLQNMIPWADENDPLDKNSLPKEPVPTAIRKGAIQALLEMKRSGIIPDAFVYTALCRAVRDDVRQVFQVYDAARAQFNAGFSRPGSKVISNKLFETFLVILSGRIQAKRMHQLVHDIWDDLRTAQIEQSSHLCLLILQRGMLDPSQINFVSDIHQKLRWRKGALKEKWTVEYYETLMRTYIRMGSNNAVDRLFTELREDGLPASR